MSSNRIIEKLLNGAEVEWKPLGAVAEIGTGNSNRQDEDENGIYPFYVRSKTILKSNTYQFDETAIIIPGEGGIGDIFHYVEGKYALHQRAYRIHLLTNEVKTKFLFYVMKNSFKQYILSKSVGATATSIRKPMLENFIIPIPPLEIQEKIVKTLDKFTELEATLEATLEAELALRKKQYQYYRETLLTFPQDLDRGGYNDITKALYHNTPVVFRALGEMGELIRGNGLQKKDFTETGVPAIHYGQIYTYYGTFADKTKSFVSAELAKKLKKAQKGDVLIAGTSENVEDVMKPLGWLGDDIVFSGDMFAFRPNKNLDTKYLTYLLQTEHFAKYKEKYAQGTKVIRLNSANLLKYEIPVPELFEQQKIVNILDKFDCLTNSISEGLPKEIALRRKQYEYYREQLLDFPK